MLSSSSLSTSSSSSAHQNQNQNQNQNQAQLDFNNNNNNKHIEPHLNPQQFNSRSLNAFTAANSAEMSLSVKNAIKLLEAQKVPGNISQSTLAAINKSKRSTSTDNVISATNGSQQSLNGTNSSTNRLNSSNIPQKHVSKNSLFNGNDIKDLLDNLNIKEAEGEVNSGQGQMSRSKSLHRDASASSLYSDLIGGSSSRRKNLLNDLNNTTITSSNLNNFASVYNNSPYQEYHLNNGINSKYLDDSSSSSLTVNHPNVGNLMTTNGSSSGNLSPHVVPKPPPGNPQRNANLYPTARYLHLFY